MADTAATGAQSVAEAVKKVADAAVAEVQKLKPAPKGDFTVSGVKGGRLNIAGNGFGAGGTVKLNGVQVNTLSWSNERIEGRLPDNARSGIVEVHIDDKTSQKAPLTI